MASEEMREVAAAIQAVEEGAGGVPGAGGGLGSLEDQGGPGDPNGQGLLGIPGEQSGSGGPSGQGSPDNQSVPGTPNDQESPEAPDDQVVPVASDNQGGACACDHHGGPDAQYEQGGHRGLGGPGTEMVRSVSLGAPHAAQAARASGPGGDAAPGAEGSGDIRIIFMINVPFRYRLEAEIVRMAMDIEHPPHNPAVRIEFRVRGRILAVRWTAEDPGLLQDAVNSFFNRLYMVMGNIQHIRHLFP
uniref:L antigen family member 3 n=1 Tax=Rousettus aegyptiacus TaxID=9407 RepID=A0A7J8ELD0_ROUAE|nr:hypothetical protein HJG63_012589 [Rousettus aegyptiacus]